MPNPQSSQRLRLPPLRMFALLFPALLLGACTKDLGAACHDLEAKGALRACKKATLSDVQRKHHIVEQWDFREPLDRSGHGSLTRFDDVGFEREAQDIIDVVRELQGFHYENNRSFVQIETRYPVDPGRQGQMVNAVDGL